MGDEEIVKKALLKWEEWEASIAETVKENASTPVSAFRQHGQSQ